MALSTPKPERPDVRLPPLQRWLTIVIILALAALAVIWGVTRGSDLGADPPHAPSHETETPHPGESQH